VFRPIILQIATTYTGERHVSPGSAFCTERERPLQNGHDFEGHAPDTPFFWGDLCREKVDYVRNFVFREINLDRINPSMPYHDPARPFVNHWFSSCRGGNANSFCETLCEANQDRLETEGGVCIM
jgi:hypothetical protein